jgi:hypothetical protein
MLYFAIVRYLPRLISPLLIPQNTMKSGDMCIHFQVISPHSNEISQKIDNNKKVGSIYLVASQR